MEVHFREATITEFFEEFASLCENVEGLTGHNDIDSYYHDVGKAIGCLYILSGVYQNSQNFIL